MSTNPLGRWLGLSGSNGKGSASSAAALDRNRLRLTASALITIGLGLALVEIWALSSLAGAQHYAGVVVGAVAVATLMGLSAIVKDEPGVWARGAVAALATVVEVLVSLSAVVTVSARTLVKMRLSRRFYVSYTIASTNSSGTCGTSYLSPQVLVDTSVCGNLLYRWFSRMAA